MSKAKTRTITPEDAAGAIVDALDGDWSGRVWTKKGVRVYLTVGGEPAGYLAIVDGTGAAAVQGTYDDVVAKAIARALKHVVVRTKLSASRVKPDEAAPDPDRAAGLLAAIAAAPDDDAPRLVYADWLMEREDPRGDFIAAACKLAALDPGKKRDQLQSQVLGLMRKHVETWWVRTIQENYQRWTYRRGFVHHAEIYGPEATKHVPALLAIEPGVRSLHLYGCDDACLTAIAGAAWLARLQRLEVRADTPAPKGLAKLAASKHLGALRELDLSQATIDAVTMPSFLRLKSLEELDLSKHAVPTDLGQALLDGKLPALLRLGFKSAGAGLSAKLRKRFAKPTEPDRGIPYEPRKGTPLYQEGTKWRY
jgi:uncharacterized protein (TIGR02996 family)